jgi:hypothetical protein
VKTELWHRVLTHYLPFLPYGSGCRITALLDKRMRAKASTTTILPAPDRYRRMFYLVDLDLAVSLFPSGSRRYATNAPFGRSSGGLSIAVPLYAVPAACHARTCSRLAAAIPIVPPLAAVAGLPSIGFVIISRLPSWA